MIAVAHLRGYDMIKVDRWPKKVAKKKEEEPRS
jgi:hypothetical protein